MNEIVLYRQLKDARWHIICRVTVVVTKPGNVFRLTLQLARAIYGPKIPTSLTKKSQLCIVTLRSILRKVTT